MIITAACVLSIGDGMGCGLMALREHNAIFDRYIAVETSKDARLIATDANHNSPGLPRIDHSWHTNLLDIIEADIIALGYNSIKQLLSGPPCQDFSNLSLITKRSARTKVSDLRPGLNGTHGRIFRNVIHILQWVLKHNPECELLIENVVFDDMPVDWKEICVVL